MRASIIFVMFLGVLLCGEMLFIMHMTRPTYEEVGAGFQDVDKALQLVTDELVSLKAKVEKKK